VTNIKEKRKKNNEKEQSNGKGNETTKKWTKQLVLESDSEIDKWMEIEGLNEEIGEYCGGGSTEWESFAAVRTIVTNSKLDAVGRMQKRHGRMASYFNRLDRGLVDKITNTFDFQSVLDSVTCIPSLTTALPCKPY